MSDDDRPDDPIPGWPGPPVPGPPPGSHPGPPPSSPPGAVPPPAAPPPWTPGQPQQGYPQQGYPQQGYAPQSYPPPGYGYGYGYPQTHEHPQGTLILVLGILSIVVCGILGPVAWIMGNKAIKEIDANPAAYSNRGNVQAGRIIGIVATCILAFVIVIYALIAVFIGLASMSAS